MPSFELKPKGWEPKPRVIKCGESTECRGSEPNIFDCWRGPAALADAFPHIDEVHWTYSREMLPIEFEYLVPIDVWQETFDAVRDLVRQQLDVNHSIFKRLGFPCILVQLPCTFICCLPIFCFYMSAMEKKLKLEYKETAEKQNQAWRELVRDLNRVYGKYKVRVTLAIEHNGGNRESMTRSIAEKDGEGGVAGLKFEFANNRVPLTAELVAPHAPFMQPQAMPPNGEAKFLEPNAPMVQTKAMSPYGEAKGVAPNASMMQTKAMSPYSEARVGSELEKIVDLHRSGALTDAEFADAKAKLLNSA